jgi:hypothetical protein
LDSPRNGTQPRFLADSLPEVVPVSDTASISDEVRVALEERGSVYLPASNTFFIREFQMAQAAEEAARFLRHACLGMRAQAGAINQPVEQQIEDALAHFGSRLLCPAVGSQSGASSQCGEGLYQSYIAGHVSKAALRRAFLTPAENPQQAQKILSLITA